MPDAEEFSGLFAAFFALQIREQHGGEPDQRRPCHHPVDELYAVGVDEVAEHRRHNAAYAEREAEEQSGDHAELVRQQLLGVQQDCREGGGEYESGAEAQRDRGRETDVGHCETERRRAHYREQYHILAAYPVADRPSYERARSGCEQEHEQTYLRELYADVEFLYQVEGVVVLETLEVDVFGDDQHAYQHYHRDGRPELQRARTEDGGARVVPVGVEVAVVPAADVGGDGVGYRREYHEPQEVAAPVGDDGHRDDERTDGAAEIASHLEDGLREPALPARCERGDARGLRVYDRRSHAYREHGDVDSCEVGCERQADDAEHREGRGEQHAALERPLVEHHSHQRLEHRGGYLVDEGYRADLCEAEVKIVLDYRIRRIDRGLQQVVQEMCETQRYEHRHGRDGGVAFDCFFVHRGAKIVKIRRLAARGGGKFPASCRRVSAVCLPSLIGRAVDAVLQSTCVR